MSGTSAGYMSFWTTLVMRSEIISIGLDPVDHETALGWCSGTTFAESGVHDVIDTKYENKWEENWFFLEGGYWSRSFWRTNPASPVMSGNSESSCMLI